MQECADNALFPQGGTWIYDRAGWCPGAPTETRDMELTPHVAGMESFTVDYDIDYDPDGNYRFEGQIVAYGPANHELDASWWRCRAERFQAFFPDQPHLRQAAGLARNSGSTPLTSAITFGLEGNRLYTWTGNWGSSRKKWSIGRPRCQPLGGG